MPTNSDINKLVKCLDGLPNTPRKTKNTFNTAPLKLLDCVLSLNRDYYSFDVPRITKFQNSHPDIDTLSKLYEYVLSTGGRVRFYQTELDYDYPDAADMFGRVLDYLVNETNKYPGNTEMEKCRNWATSVKVDGYKNIFHGKNIPLFGIAGWQYLRMLFGADTCKPDIAVKRFVKNCLGKGFTDINTVRLLESAARITPSLKQHSQPAREADHRIWRQYNMNKQTKQACH